MSEIIFLQIGQCGNQIGWEFWEKALKEHKDYHKNAPYDLSYKSFFEIRERGSFENIKDVRARAVLIDSETNVTKQLETSAIRDIFRGCSISVDVGGAGNNWAVGYHQNGHLQIDSVLEKIRKLAEPCNHLESFFMLYSLGGGTGSGFGSYILERVAEEYPRLWKMATVVTPTDDDPAVVTAPYNSLLSCAHLCKYANCVFPVENASLQRFVSGAEPNTKGAFSQMNSVVANFLLDLTAGSRFSGKMNVDLSEIETNMVPFPHHKFLVGGISPIYPKNPPRSEKSFFSEAMSNKATLCDIDHSQGTYLSTALLIRGNISESSVQQNTTQLAEKMKFPKWNTEHWKIGLCSTPSLTSKISICSLCNTTSITGMFDTILGRYTKLASRGAYIHLFNDNGVEREDFEEAADLINFVRDEYDSVATEDDVIPPRPKIFV
ncbi:Tubulin/FtsZ family, GTPase domain containing protein [Trichomonas vaginalis G3]|uniref:Tubulin/FtsZ family, GTPase domain containing protein n=1 Tax=Trichomonas vaginalis (strain ATCC PRA-98 / G3) TaxID=412133 RepID=A2ELX8_TRIV3|nr:structural constituent of cytoskeleton [Trichomonas vaginalis G3]EAY06317.1 Tubulin/FtsZ family, GTPase domain containing protein [Trichomonas vaginalis G3]KAI5489853.1 structural constituent of cytoskeleton [Trichomonas vaginalis G3]|eukprot:XP_001318540.1 Tubulin/FtsZ family, GTPase domain containing protein [Trichomonas vaginalis G3]